MPWTLNIHHTSNYNAFFPVKINKIWNFCLKLWFFRNCLSQRLKTYGIRFSMPQTLHMCHSSHVMYFSHSKSTKCEILDVSLTPPDKKWKNINFNREKVLKRIPNQHIYVFGYADYNALCWKFVWQVLFELSWFFLIFTGRSRYGVLKHGVWVKWDPRTTAA